VQDEEVITTVVAGTSMSG
nr:immunoglobulin heavy chain junction region [Mus musculus]